jgi:hypothetical protein
MAQEDPADMQVRAARRLRLAAREARVATQAEAARPQAAAAGGVALR